MTAIQKYLRSGSSLESLTENFGIQIKRDSEFSNLVLLKYDQIDSHPHMGNRVVQECRGIILDELDNWRIVARSFDKFFNIGEQHVAEIDWNDASVLEKVDGSLCTLYSYNGIWRVATTGSPNASGKVHNADFSFAEYFWNTFQKCNLNIKSFDCNHCYMFELIGPYNRIVVPYHESNLILLGSRDLLNQKEITANYTNSIFELKANVVKSFPLRSLDEVLKFLPTINPLQQEGIVVLDNKFNRVKGKNAQYVALHHMRSSFSEKNCIEVIRLGETSELTLYFPEIKEVFNNLNHKFETLVSKIDFVWQQNKDIENKKEFALKVKDLPFSGILFALKNGRISSIRQGLKEIHIDRLMEMFDAN